MYNMISDMCIHVTLSFYCSVKLSFFVIFIHYYHWVQAKRHRLWFSTKTVYLLLNENSCKQHDPHSQIEFDFVEKHIH